MSEKPVFDRDHAPGVPELAPPSASIITSLFAEGLALHQAGRLVEAEEFYHRVLAIQPDHFDSLHLLGVIFWQRGHHAEAVRRIDLALKLNPSHSPALNNRGNALMALRRFEEALTSYGSRWRCNRIMPRPIAIAATRCKS